MANEDKIRRKSHARIDYNVQPSYEPNPTPDPEIDRDLWIETVSSELNIEAKHIRIHSDECVSYKEKRVFLE